ncbi:MAG: hypothetical protein QOG80_2070 [Pseudonocardiales bacterium]|nr:hypothetical protein [Pseudonocardiales bacterium]
MTGRPRRFVAALAAIAVLGGCSTVTSGHGSPLGVSATVRTSPTPPSSTAPNPEPPACPVSYAIPDRHRPTVTLGFRVAADLASVRGIEHVVFTPDEPISELVFRLTANTPPSVVQGNRIVVTSASADHGAGPAAYTRSGASASTQGGLLHLPFARRVAAGTTVTADIDFTVTLGAESFDRFGRTGDGPARYAWFASAQPLLAWERGFGWHEEDLIAFTAESATSEAMDTDLTVTAPAGDIVIASGDPAAPAGPSGSRTWHSHIAAARDVSVAVGPFVVSDSVVNGTKLRLGAFSTAERDKLVPEFTRAVSELVKRYGPFPFPSLSVARLPAGGGGIEYPSSILMFDSTRVVAVHETAHQWFYAMVGDSQALHPWLDEAFAMYSEQAVNGDPEPAESLHAPGAVDRSTESYGKHVGDYYFVTYNKGAAALEAARAAAGPAKFDAALRCYVNANAWRIANPADLAKALSGLPVAVRILRTAGALH